MMDTVSLRKRGVMGRLRSRSGPSFSAECAVWRVNCSRMACRWLIMAGSQRHLPHLSYQAALARETMKQTSVLSTTGSLSAIAVHLLRLAPCVWPLSERCGAAAAEQAAGGVRGLLGGRPNSSLRGTAHYMTCDTVAAHASSVGAAVKQGRGVPGRIALVPPYTLPPRSHSRHPQLEVLGCRLSETRHPKYSTEPPQLHPFPSIHAFCTTRYAWALGLPSRREAGPP
jgi:hypothetical protein